MPNRPQDAFPRAGAGEAAADRSVSTLSGIPVLHPDALYGLAGELVSTIDPHTEASKAAVLISFLTAFGNAVGDGPYFVADGAKHPPRLFSVVVGTSSRSRKGTSWQNVRNVMLRGDPVWTENRVQSGLSSGEGLITAVGDSSANAGGVSDKRLQVVEEEFARVLLTKGRESNTLSPLLRQAWDTGDLHSLTKQPLSATGAHISIIGHITKDELQRKLSDSDMANGFANRFLFVLVDRSKHLPNGGTLTEEAGADLGRKVADALEAARRVEQMSRSELAEERWVVLYRELAEEDAEGIVGTITKRAEAQILRLSSIFALLDGSAIIDIQHLAAAEAVWRYSCESVEMIFGDVVGDEVAQKLYAAISAAGFAGMDGTQRRDLFGGHRTKAEMDVALNKLESDGLISPTTVKTGGKPRKVYVVTKATKVAEVESSDTATKATEACSVDIGRRAEEGPVPVTSGGVLGDLGAPSESDRWEVLVK